MLNIETRHKSIIPLTVMVKTLYKTLVTSYGGVHLQGRMEKNIMKKIIDGIVYDTEVSKELGSCYDEFYKETVTLFVDEEENYFLSYENGNIEPLDDESKLKLWVAKNLDVEASERILDVTYTVVIEFHEDGEEYEDEFDPESQSWDDIEKCFAEACSIVEDEFPTYEYQGSWEVNDFQPACMYEDNKGNTAEVYVRCCG